MKKFFVVFAGVFALVLASNGVLASEGAPHVEAVKTTAVKKGDAAKGKEQAMVCSACHGRNGDSGIASNPKLAGQNAKYLLKQMQDFQSGARSDAIMNAQMAGKSLADLENIAAYYAEQEISLGKADPALVALGQKIYRGGNEASGVSACIACHGPKGKGVAAAGFPALGGQHAQYTVKQLTAFRAAGRGDHKGTKRTNDGKEGEATMMQDVAAKMSDDEIAAVASYIAGLR